ncbi:MAG: hypothetical protein GY789_01475 [Hyphomicrobiales bacterium]|nr:hypothetical protein [Hyphomicrobiales bacterium]MCP4997395.1 hypothetical protein [Hyphomicrobiales bacterium]
MKKHPPDNKPIESRREFAEKTCRVQYVACRKTSADPTFGHLLRCGLYHGAQKWFMEMNGRLFVFPPVENRDS